MFFFADAFKNNSLVGVLSSLLRIEKQISEKRKSGTKAHIDHRVLLQKHGRHNDQYGKDQGTDPDTFTIF